MRLRLLIIAAALAAVLPGPARAFQVVATFSGQVTQVQSTGNPPPPGVVVGAPVSGTVVYETTAASVSYSGLYEADYGFPDGAMTTTVTIASSSWSDSKYGVVFVRNDDPSLGDEAGFSNMHAGGGEVVSIGLDFQDQTPPYDLVFSLNLPTTNADLNLSAATSSTGTVHTYLEFDNSLTVDFDVNAISFNSPTATQNTTLGRVKALFR